LIGSRCGQVDSEGRLVVEVDAEHAFFKTNLESDDNRRFIEGVIREVFGRTLRYVVQVGGGEDAGAPSAEGAAPEPPDSSAGGPPTSEPESPRADKVQAAPRPAGKSPFEIAQTDENVQRVMELFDGEITS
jgi:hypothetical protein